MARVRRALIFAASTCGAATLAAGCGSSTETNVAEHRAAPRSEFAGATVVSPSLAPPFELRDATGRQRTLAQERGRYVLVTFLYTHCPDVCPLIASNLNTALRTLGPLRRQVRVLAVSVDPQGDTATAVRAYARRLRLLPQFGYLVGTTPELQRVWHDYHVLAVSRSADHVAYTALVDRRGRERVIYDSKVRAQDVVHDLRVLFARDRASS